jgi:hypothetical protein
MPYEISVDRDQELIEIHVMGETNPLEALEARNRTALIAKELGYRKVAVYGAQLEKVQGFSPAMLLNFVTSFQDKPFPTGTKFAIIPSQVNDRLTALARIARENGTRMHVFKRDNLALDWLADVLSTTELEAI